LFQGPVDVKPASRLDQQRPGQLREGAEFPQGSGSCAHILVNPENFPVRQLSGEIDIEPECPDEVDVLLGAACGLLVGGAGVIDIITPAILLKQYLSQFPMVTRPPMMQLVSVFYRRAQIPFPR
jgi:hypothetical protein